jgi:PAS domain S-box-containing protein
MFKNLSISTKQLLGLVSILIISTVSFVFLYFQMQGIKQTIQRDTTSATQDIQNSSTLNSIAQFIRYYDEVLTQSARNYAFTADVKWKTRYDDNALLLDEKIQEAIQKGDDQDKQLFSQVDTSNQALVKMETDSMTLVDNGNKAGAIAILESSEYAAQKAIYSTALEQYVQSRGTKYDEALQTSTAKILQLNARINTLIERAQSVQVVWILLLVGLIVVMGLFISRKILRPITSISQAARAVAEGDLNQKVNFHSQDEIGRLGKAFNTMVASLKSVDARVKKQVTEQTRVLTKQSRDLELQQSAMLNVLEDIEAEKAKASQAAIDMQKYLMAVENASDQVVITDPEGIVLYGNRAMEKMTGYTRKEALGRKAGTLWKKPMSLPYYQKLWTTIKTERHVFSSIIQNRRKNGELYDADISISPILDEHGVLQYFVAIERDVTERQRSIENAERLATIVRTTEDAIIGKTLEGVITSWNEGAQKLYGYSEQEVLGKSIDIIVPKDRLAELKNIMTGIVKGEKVEHLQTLRKKKDGSLVDVSITSSPIRDGKGKIIGASTIARDITKEKAVDRAKTEFVSLASHQLRTPLSAINWYTEMLLNGDAGKINKDQKEYLQEVYHGSQRMVDLVNALLNVSRIDLGTFAVEPKPTKIQDIADIAIKDLKQQLKEKHITFVQDFGKAIPAMPLDGKLMLIVLQNLLSNAVKYTPAKGTVTLRIAKTAKQLSIEVQDTGYGIDPKDQVRIFQKLFRADNVREKVPDGTGLGLYIVKAVLEQSGGSISFTSTLGKGTTFRAILPATGMQAKSGTKGLNA